MKNMLTLALLRGACERGELEGINDTQLCIDYVRKFQNGEGLPWSELHSRGCELRRRLDAGEAVPEHAPGFPNIADYPGETPLARAIAYMEATLGDSFTKRSTAEKTAAGQALLDDIKAAGGDPSTPSEDDGDDPQLSAHAEAVQRLSAGSPTFRAMTHREQCFDPRTRALADRIRSTRAMRSAARVQRALADASSVSPPAATPIGTWPTAALPSLTELRAYPGARGVETDVARAISWMITQTNGAFGHNSWGEQCRQATALVRSIYAREPLPQPQLRAGGAR